MTRLTHLDDVFFPVEEYPVFASIRNKTGENQIAIPNKKAIVNLKSGRVVGVVGSGYRLVTNREALEMASECCQSVFPETKPGEWTVRATDAPATGGHCYIDLVHNSAGLDFSFVQAKDRPDVFGPFIRVTNSYNGLRALSFDIGFYRKVCRNGLIAPQSVIRFKFVHARSAIGEVIKFEIARERLAGLQTSFTNYLGVLRDFRVGRNQFETLAFAVLWIHKPKHAIPASKTAADWEALEKHLATMCDRYASELGENAYAVFNAITEFASHPPENRCIYQDRHGFQRRAGAWLNDFSRECRLPGFSLERHIEGIKKSEGGKQESSADRPGRREQIRPI